MNYSENGKPECNKQSKADRDELLEVILVVFLSFKQYRCRDMQKDADDHCKNIVKVRFKGTCQGRIKKIAEN